MNASPTAILSHFTPASMLRSGYIRIYLDDQDAWLFAEVEDDISDWVSPIGDDRHQQVLARLAGSLQEFFHMSAAEWEAHLKTTVQPATVLRLWETMADTWDYFTLGKKLSAAAQRDYFRILLAFFNHESQCLDGYQPDALHPGRVERVVNELDRYFNRRQRRSRRS